jgi:hypothetical protein
LFFSVWASELLTSYEWTDRNKASLALLVLTTSRDPKALALLRKRALQPLKDMAAWKVEGHAYPGFVLLGRLAQMPEEEILNAPCALL